MKSVVDQELFPKSHAHQFGFRFARKSPSTRSQFFRVAPCSTRSRGRLTKTPEPRKFHDPAKKQLVQSVGKGARFLYKAKWKHRKRYQRLRSQAEGLERAIKSRRFTQPIATKVFVYRMPAEGSASLSFGSARRWGAAGPRS
jgi:hypothetical protein